ncbi:hypothetical protein EDD17DRAFT_1752927 [Pisolithus thermaeus]|nr:hypothetical protein EDD17DRAFT_1752927 [Pisolithus thermaeus]
MSLSGHSQSTLTDLDGLDDEASIVTHISSILSTSRSAQTGFEEALKTTQLQLDVKQTCNHELKERNAILEASKPQCLKKNVPPELLAYDSEIRMLAKKYGITVKHFFPCTPTTNAVSQLSPIDSPSFSSADHYATILTEEVCLIAELDMILPEHLCHFVQGMQSGRSNILYKLQDNADQIFKLLKVHFIPNFPHLEVLEIMKMLRIKDTGTVSPCFTIWYPLLFKNMKVEMRKPFSNWCPLRQILKAALWGKASLVDGFMWHSGPKMNGWRWQVSTIMPGSIAWAATITANSQEMEVFWAYKWVLVVKWTDLHIQQIVGEMNAFILEKSGSTSAQSKTGAIKDLLAETDAALAAMDVVALTEDGDQLTEPKSPTLMVKDNIAAGENNSASVSHFTTVIVPTDMNTMETMSTSVPKSGGDSSSPSDQGGIRDTTAIDTTRPGTSPDSGHVDIPVPGPTQAGTGTLTPALADVQPTGPRRPEGSVDVPIHAQPEEVTPGSPSSALSYRLDPTKAKEHIDRIRRFRILVMGRANAGKTTILQRVCNTTDQPEISNGKGEKVDAAAVQGSLTRGYHNIEDELVFRSNPGFVFHDSCGFEAGSEEQFDVMRKFVRDRAKTTKLNERIHAIWFCIPLNESHRMVMAAEKKFFQECDTGHVPVIVLLTKADTLALDAVQELMNKGKSVGDAMNEAAVVEKGILDDCLKRVKDWLNKERFPPKDYLSLTANALKEEGLQREGAECTPLLACTANALKEEGLQQLLISTQQSNLELCMEFAIMKSLKKYMEVEEHEIQPGILALHLSMWFPYVRNGGILWKRC